MRDTGYATYQDPRLQPPTEPDVQTCGECAYYRDAGTCVLEIFFAKTHEELRLAHLIEVDPDDEACVDFEVGP